ncbi:MAG TPA: group 1 truncated hemoglobin [Burkholderiaceae bacterium]
MKRFLTGAALLALAAPAMPMQAAAASVDDSVYQALGGQQGLKAIVGDFLNLVLADDRIKTQFADADMAHLAMRLNEQLCELSGGPCHYGGKDMATIHADLHITNAQFNALAEDLQSAMEKHHVPAREQNKLLAKLAPMQRSIVTK